MRAFSALLLFGACWAVTQFLVPDTLHWRDSGEFILTAAYLDISHSPGSPFYAMWSNLWSLLPFGHMTWRITSATSLIALSVLVLLWTCARLTLSILFPSLSKTARSILSFLAPLILLGTESFAKALLTVEVYGLLSAFFLGLYICCIKFEVTNDKRWLLSACFLAGLGVGAHIGLAPLVVVSLLPIFAGRIRQLQNCLIPGLALLLFAYSIYAYLPIRAQTELSLNTGSPSSTERLINHLSNSRDRALRPTATQGDASFERPFATLFSQLTRSFALTKSEFGSEALMLAAIGCGGVLFYNARIFGLLILPLLTHSWLFAGWDSDPWLLSYSLLALAITMVGGRAIATSHNHKLQILLALLCAILPTTNFYAQSKNIRPILLKDFDTPSASAETLLDKLPKKSMYVTEASWFILKYLQDIEGYRNDVQLIYQPSILFPQYFRPLSLASQGSSIELRTTKTNSAQNSEMPAELQQLANFISSVSTLTTLSFEPNPTINNFLSGVARCDDQGIFSLIPGRTRQFKETCLNAAANELAALKFRANSALYPLSSDTTHYLEARLNGLADLLVKSAYMKEAIQILENTCLPISSNVCSIISINNLLAYYIDSGNLGQARKLAGEIGELGLKSYPAAVRQNLEKIKERGEKHPRQ